MRICSCERLVLLHVDFVGHLPIATVGLKHSFNPTTTHAFAFQSTAAVSGGPQLL